MIKVALLIRVADPARDLQPGTANEVATLQQVLLSAVGDFTAVETLNNSEPIAMQQAIEALFGDRHPDDLVLLYFSGQSLKDDRGKLYWATRDTCQDAQGKLVKSTAVAADFLQDVMNDSHAQQQVVILDCWLGGLEAEVQSAIAAAQEQLGGPGRVILTAASATQNGREHQRSNRSTYTDYLVEGLETGAADLDHDGIVSLNELHEYSRRKLQKSAPAIQPEIYPAVGDNQIQIGKVPVRDSQLRYRQEVERCANSGGISIVSRSVLDLVKDQLGLAPDVATVIEGQVLKPYQVYQQNLQRYAQAVVKAIHQEYPLPPEVRDRLNRLQQVFGLRDQDTAPIEVQAYQVKVEQSAVKIPLHQKTLPDHPATSRGATLTIDSLSSVDVASRTTRSPLIPATRNPAIRQKNRWLLSAAIAALVLGVVYGWRQWQVTRLQSLQALAAQRDYQRCLEVGTTSVHNPQTQKLLQQCQAGATWQNVQVQSLSGHLDSIWSVAVNPDGQTLASGSNDRTIKLWSVRGRLLRTLRGHSSDVLSVAISPDGQTLASGSNDRTIKIWHLPTGKLLHTLSGHSHEVWSVAISPDGQTLASGSNDRTIKLWSVRGRLLRTLRGHSSDVLSVAISPDGQTLASGSKDRTIKLWNLSTGRLLRTLSGHSDLLRSVNFTPDGKFLASSSWDQTIKIWHLPTGELSRTLSGHSSYVNAIAISSHQTLASGSDDNTIKLWNLQTGQLLRTLRGHSSHVNSVAFSPDGKVLTSGSQDKNVKIWRQ